MRRMHEKTNMMITWTVRKCAKLCMTAAYQGNMCGVFPSQSFNVTGSITSTILSTESFFICLFSTMNFKLSSTRGGRWPLYFLCCFWKIISATFTEVGLTKINTNCWISHNPINTQMEINIIFGYSTKALLYLQYDIPYWSLGYGSLRSLKNN